MAGLQRDVSFLVIGLASDGSAAADRLAAVIGHSHLINFDFEDRLDRRFDGVLAGVVRNAKGEHLAITFDGLFVFAVTDVVRALLFHLESLLSDHRRFEHIPNRWHNFYLYE